MSRHVVHPRPQSQDMRLDVLGTIVTFRTLEMTTTAHKPQDILDEVANLAKLPLALHNVTFARDVFVTVYKEWKGRNKKNDLRQLIDSGHLRSAMTALDIYFFGRALTRTTPSRHWTALKELYVEGNIFAEGQRGYAVRLQHAISGLASTCKDGQTTIYIDALNANGSPRTPESILEILVHEMAHAIYQSFSCRCQGCNCLDPKVLGPYGHGRLWVGLAHHMGKTIRSWDEALKNFYAEDLIRLHHFKPPEAITCEAGHQRTAN